MGDVKDKNSVEEWGTYVTCPDLQIEREVAQKNYWYWGKHLDRLRSMKGSAHPRDSFSYPQRTVPAV